MVGRMLQDDVKVLPIHLFYDDCSAMSKGDKGYGTRKITNLKAPKSLAEGDITLIALHGAPLDLRPLFSHNDVSPDEYPFIILIKNSPASVPLQ